MGVKAVSLPDELIKELEDAAKRGNRGFSAEVRMRCESYPTGVAKDRLDSTIKFSDDKVYTAGEEVKPGWLGIAEKSDEATAKLETEVEKTLEPASGAIRKAVDDGLKDMVVYGVAKFPGVSELAKKIAKEVPGVKVASEFKAPAADEMPDFSGLSGPVISAKPGGLAEDIVKSAKKRPEETEGRVELVKGFWRETFDSVGDAMVEVAQKGWKEGEYTIKPLK